MYNLTLQFKQNYKINRIHYSTCSTTIIYLTIFVHCCRNFYIQRLTGNGCRKRQPWTENKNSSRSNSPVPKTKKKKKRKTNYFEIHITIPSTNLLPLHLDSNSSFTTTYCKTLRRPLPRFYFHGRLLHFPSARAECKHSKEGKNVKRKEEKKRRLEENFETRASRNVTERISSRSSMQQACICAIERCRCNWQPCRAVCQASTFSRVSRVPNQFPAFTRRRATVIVRTHCSSSTYTSKRAIPRLQLLPLPSLSLCTKP